MEDTGGDMDHETLCFDVPATTFIQRWWWAFAGPALGGLASLAWALVILPPVAEPAPTALSACASEVALDHLPYCRGSVADVERLGSRAIPKAPPLLYVPELPEPSRRGLTIGCWSPPPLIRQDDTISTREGARQAVLGVARIALVGDAQRRIAHRFYWQQAEPTLQLTPIPFAASTLLALPLIALGRRRPRAHTIEVGAHHIQVDDRRFPWSKLLTARLTRSDRRGRCTLILEPECGPLVRVRLLADPGDAARLQALLAELGPQHRDWHAWFASREEARAVHVQARGVASRRGWVFRFRRRW